MDNYREVFCKCINHKSKYMSFKSKSHEEFDKYEHIVLSLKEIDIINVDETFDLYNIEHRKIRLLSCEMSIYISF